MPFINFYFNIFNFNNNLNLYFLNIKSWEFETINYFDFFNTIQFIILFLLIINIGLVGFLICYFIKNINFIFIKIILIFIFLLQYFYFHFFINLLNFLKSIFRVLNK